MTELTVTARYIAGDEQITIHPDDYHTDTPEYTTFLWDAEDDAGVAHVRCVPTDHVIDIQKDRVQ